MAPRQMENLGMVPPRAAEGAAIPQTESERLCLPQIPYAGAPAALTEAGGLAARSG